MPKSKKTITPDDLYRVQLITHCEVSPDGENIIFSLQGANRQTHKYSSNLWLAKCKTSSAIQFTYGDRKVTMPLWSPDGTQIAFLSNRDAEDQPQLYILPFRGGEARPLTKLKGEFGDFLWSPDCKKLLVQFRLKDKSEVDRNKDPKKKELGIISRRYDRIHYKLDGTGYLPESRWHLWLVDAQTGHATQLTKDDLFNEYSASWHPDGSQIIFCSNRQQDPDLSPDQIDLFVLTIRDGKSHKIETPVGPKILPAFSPDGEWIAYFGYEGLECGWKNTDLWILPTDGSRQARNITADDDLHISNSTINDMGNPPLMPPVWSNDNQRVYFQSAKHGDTLLLSVAIDGSDLRTIIGKSGVVGAFSFDKKQEILVYFHGTMKDPGQIESMDLRTGKIRRCTAVNKSIFRNIDLGVVNEVWFKGASGNNLQGWILTPPGFDKTKKYPSILEIHGGPLVQYGNFFMHEFFFLAAQGYVVYFCNPRGGRGYGEDHAKAIWNDWGNLDYNDLMAWSDTIAQQPYIDQNRMGVTGGSYGGYMTAWIIGHTDRYKAAVAQRLVSNLTSMWGSSDFNWQFQSIFGGKPPWGNFENYLRQSPVKYIHQAKTPTMIIHSERDMRCSQEQGEQIYVALKYLGVDSELILFPDEPHGLSRTGRIDRRIERLKHIVRWMDTYLKDKTTPPNESIKTKHQ